MDMMRHMKTDAALTAQQHTIGDLIRAYEPRWRIEGGRTGEGFVAWRRGTRRAGAIEASTVDELAEQLTVAEAAT
jgi:hypothetical protein